MHVGLAASIQWHDQIVDAGLARVCAVAHTPGVDAGPKWISDGG